MEIKGLKIKACVFDLDGTILDSCSVWSQVDNHFFSKRGMEVPHDYNKAITALGLEESAHYTKTTYHFNDSEQDIIQEWLGDVSMEYANNVPLKANAKLFLEYLKKNNIPMAVATANTKACYEPCLKRLGIYDDFSFIHDVANIKGGKNTPEIFHWCAKRFNLKPEEILVIEDSLISIKAAKSAGFKICAIYEDVCKDEKEKMEIADIYIHDFTELLK